MDYNSVGYSEIAELPFSFFTAFVSRWLEGGYLDEERRKEKSVPALS